MPGASPPSHDASGWGSSTMGALSQWHHEQGSPPLGRNPPRVDGWVGRPPIALGVKGGRVKRAEKVHKCTRPEVPTDIPTRP